MTISRILIVGYGSIGKRHLRLARRIFPDADIRVFRHSANREIPDFSNGCFFKAEEAIDFRPEIAVIANPAPFHIAIAQSLACCGSNLLIEKPLSDKLDDISQLIRSCSENNTVLLVGYNLRFLNSLQHYRTLLNSEVIGKIFSVRCEAGQYLPAWREGVDYRKTASAKRELGGGALLELSHELDYLRWIYGDIEWVKATLSKQGLLEVNVEDTAHLTLGFTAKCGQPQLVCTLNLDFLRHDRTRLCVAIGENGSLSWNGLTGDVRIYESGAKEWRLIYECSQHGDESYMAEWMHLIDCIEHGVPPLISGQDGYSVLKVIDAARKSAESHGLAYKVE